MHYGGVGRLHTYRAGINIVLGLKVSPIPNFRWKCIWPCSIKVMTLGEVFRARSHENTYYITQKKKRKLVVLIRKMDFAVYMLRAFLACI